MRSRFASLLMLAFVATSLAPASAADEDAAADPDELRSVLESFDGALADVSRDIDEWEAWIADPDVVMFEHDGVVLAFHLAQLDELAPLAFNILKGETELQRLITDRRPELGIVISGIEFLGDAAPGIVVPQLKNHLRQDEETKRAVATARLEDLHQERAMVDDLIDSLQDDLDRALEAEASGGSSAAFPPEWLQGKNSFAVLDRYGPPPLSDDPTFVLQRAASTYAENCWTHEDGLHYCARRPEGWVGVYQDFELGYLWYDLVDLTTCELHVTATTASSTSGLYEPCPDNPDAEQLFTFTLVGVEWDY